jgi:hypothetical protein
VCERERDHARERGHQSERAREVERETADVCYVCSSYAMYRIRYTLTRTYEARYGAQVLVVLGATCATSYATYARTCTLLTYSDVCYMCYLIRYVSHTLHTSSDVCYVCYLIRYVCSDYTLTSIHAYKRHKYP